MAMGETTPCRPLLGSVPTILLQCPSSQSQGWERALPIPSSTPLQSLLSSNASHPARACWCCLPPRGQQRPDLQDRLHENMLFPKEVREFQRASHSGCVAGLGEQQVHCLCDLANLICIPYQPPPLQILKFFHIPQISKDTVRAMGA